MTSSSVQPAAVVPEKDPWPALWALVLGFFMIMVDTTIVSVATPAIIEDLEAEVNSVVWVTSAYLLAYAVPVLITGRLGDRFGPKNLYMIGLTVFTLASLWCGLTNSVGALIVARIVQGLGASMITPQTMAIITRIFPAERRGRATALWGATAGVALLVGPLLGGVLIDSLNWRWIFFVNVPVGIIGLLLAARLVPKLPTHPHRFDWLGVALSGAGMFLLVFGIQEGHQYEWGRIVGFVSVPLMIGGGLLVLGLFVLWQSRNKAEPLVPLGLFKDRNFSLANIGIGCVSFAFTAIGFPLMLWAQLVRGLTPTQAALLLIPMALMSILLAPGVGKLTDRVHPRNLIALGFGILAGAMLWLALGLSPDAKYGVLLIPMALMGCGSACIWAPLTATATRNLPLHLAGAGAGVYNTSRQVGAVLGAAAVAVLMDARLAANGLGSFDPSDPTQHAAFDHMPAAAQATFFDHFSTAMGESLLVTPAVLLLGFAAALLLIRPKPVAPGAPPVLVD